jgi:hypothetical protein
MAYKINGKGKFVSKAVYDEWLKANQLIPLPQLVSDIETNQSNRTQAMVERINAALKDRAEFELRKAPNGSHIELRKVAGMFADNRRVAAFLCAVDADPDLMFNRVRKNGTRSNLKGFTKVRKLIDYVTGRTKVFERVSLALFASTIIAANKGVSWIASPEQELILSSESVNSLPRDVQEAIADYKHKHMTLEGDSRPQACQFRTTFANLGVYEFYRDEFDNTDYTLGISVIMSSPIVRYLNDVWQLERFN